MSHKRNVMTLSRRRAFNIALQVRSEKDGEEWTRRRFAEENGVSATMIYRVLTDDATSARLDEAIDDFINENWPPRRSRIAA